VFDIVKKNAVTPHASAGAIQRVLPARRLSVHLETIGILAERRNKPNGQNPSDSTIRLGTQRVQRSLFCRQEVTWIVVPPHGLEPVTVPYTSTPVPGGMKGSAPISA